MINYFSYLTFSKYSSFVHKWIFLLSADWVLFLAFHDKATSSKTIESLNNGTDNFSTSTHFESDQSNPRDTLPLAWNEQILSFFEQRFELLLLIEHKYITIKRTFTDCTAVV